MIDEIAVETPPKQKVKFLGLFLTFLANLGPVETPAKAESEVL